MTGKGKLKVSKNGRYLQYETGEPFFWLADTGWLLFQKLSLEETKAYFTERKRQGFNVIMAMVLHSPVDENYYGERALVNGSLTESFANEDGMAPSLGGYWDHIDRVIDLAGEMDLFIALVPAWGSLLKGGILNEHNAEHYGRWLAGRFGGKSHILWIMGGDIRGDWKREIWQILAETIKDTDPNHLMTYHPFGRTQSSQWFHDESWLDFNMFQSGHRRYDQRVKSEFEDDENIWIGQDNWRYVEADYKKRPIKPTLDGEPSYESIPQGLHDPSQPYWTADDVRRYAYWAVFSGACGHTYGHNAVMQMHKPGSPDPSYGVREYWDDALTAEGAGQMKWLKELILDYPFFERRPAQDLILSESGPKYERIVATRGPGYIMVYQYIPSPFIIDTECLGGRTLSLRWMNPVSGLYSQREKRENRGIIRVESPVDGEEMHDRVLIISDRED